MADNDNPVMDEGVPYRERPYTAGGKQQGDLSGRKRDLLSTGTIGHTPGRGYRPDMHMQETPQKTGRVPGSDDMEYAPKARPTPREIPVQTHTTHFGNITRYLDGHSEVHRDRPGLAAMLNDPDMSDYHADIRSEIANRDAIHSHRFW